MKNFNNFEYRISQEACKFLINHISPSRLVIFDMETFMLYLNNEFLSIDKLNEKDIENKEKIEKMVPGKIFFIKRFIYCSIKR
jgi:hypothetical protein